MSSTNTKQLMKMYREYGLSEPFAMAIVEGKDSEAIMEFWNQDWHKQYPDADDVLVIAVLEQTITPEEGEWLNSVRSNHEALVQSCLDGSVTIEWAKSLMDAGFLNHSKEVSDILKGGDPIVIAMLSGIELESDLLPPKLEMKTKNTDFFSNNVVNFNSQWKRELLREPRRSYISFFMMHYLPGIPYDDAHVFGLMRVLSTMQETISSVAFWQRLKDINFKDGQLMKGMQSIYSDAFGENLRRDVPSMMADSAALLGAPAPPMPPMDAPALPGMPPMPPMPSPPPPPPPMPRMETEAPAVPSMGNQHFSADVWIQGMIQASKFWRESND